MTRRARLNHLEGKVAKDLPALLRKLSREELWHLYAVIASPAKARKRRAEIEGMSLSELLTVREEKRQGRR